MFGAIEIRWRRLRLALAVCAAAAMTGGAAAAVAWWQEHRVTERMEAAEARLAEARGRYSALAGEQRKWRRFGPLYRRLAARGRIGEEQPARWTEAVQSAAPGVLAARHRLGSPHVVERRGPVEVRATDMSIDFDLRHEAELPVFLAALEREAPGTFTVSGCRLVRTDDARGEEPLPSAVGGSCRIRWQSVVLSGTEPGWRPDAGAPSEDEAGDEAGNGVAEALSGSRPRLVEPTREAFGRLFTTVEERAAIESALAARDAATDAAGVPEAPPTRTGPLPQPPARTRPIRWVRVGGVVARSGRSVVAWIDGRRVAYDEAHAQETTPADGHPPGVRLDTGGRSIRVRAGQRFDPHTGAVIDPVRRPRDGLRRDRFLQKSSRAPLTDSPVPGQN